MFFLIEYFYWHYAIAPVEILKLAGNFSVGTWRKFFIGAHFRNLLAPWHRMSSLALVKSENIADKIVLFFLDFYVRILVALIRLTIIIIGLFAEGIVLSGFAFFMITWLFWPVIFFILFSRGLSLLF